MRPEFVNTWHETKNYGFDYKRTTEWQAYIALRSIGWCALGASVPTFVVGVLTGAASYESPSEGPKARGLLITSAVLAGVSVPVLTVAYCLRHKAKKKARQMSLGVTTIDSKMPFNAVAYTPALSMSFTF